MKASIPYFGINRCGLFSILAVLPVLSGTVRLADHRRLVVRAVMALLFCFAAGAIEPARLQDPRLMWTPPGLSGPTRIPPTG
jgi:hypothetical protein